MADRLIEKIRSSALEKPGKPAVTGFQSAQDTITYRELYERALLLGQKLTKYGDIEFAFVIAARTPDIVTALLAGFMAGIPIAIIDHRLGSLRIANILKRAHRALGMIDSLGVRTMESVMADHEIRAVVHLETLESFNQNAGSITPSEFELHKPSRGAGETAVVLFTSGSTGSPKGVCVSRRDLDARLAAEQEWFGLTDSDRILGILPLSFDVGLTQLLGTLWSGGHHILANSWLPVDVVDKLKRMDIHGLAMSPMVWKSMIRASEKLNIWDLLNRLRYVTLSGGTLAMDQLRAVSSCLRDGVLIKTYGQTEMFRIASLKVSEAEKSRLGSVGKPYIGVTLRIVDAEGEDCPPGNEGEIIASGMGAMSGYLDTTIQCQQNNPQAIWISTGDYGYLDEDGYLYIRGRKDEMLKILDQRIFPNDVANMVMEALGVKYVEVIAVDREMVELAIFYLTAELEMPPSEILPLLRKQLASYLLPKHLVGLKEFPSTPSGKVDRIALKQMVAKQYR